MYVSDWDTALKRLLGPGPLRRRDGAHIGFQPLGNIQNSFLI